MKTIRARLLVILLVLLTIVIAAFSALTYLLARQSLDSDIDQFAVDKALILAQRVNPNNLSNIHFFERDWWSRQYTPHGQTYDTNWQPMFVSFRLSAPFVPTENVKRAAIHPSGIVFENLTDPGGKRYRVATVPREHNGAIIGFAQMGVPLSEAHRDRRRLLLWLTIAGALTLLASGFAINYVLRQWSTPLTGLADTAGKMTPENLAHRRLFAPAEIPELARLAENVNQLLDNLESTRATQQQFIADASHELRTPLTILRGEIEVALRRTRSAEEYREVLQSSREEIERLARLADNLLVLARVDAGHALQRRERIDLTDVCRSVAAKLEMLAHQKGVLLVIAPGGTAMALGDRMALERVATNLIENAIAHTPAGDVVRVNVVSSPAEVCLQVIDSGPGICEDQIPRIFERFYRIDAARSREAGGAGLGLAIVKTLVQAHGGRVEVQSVFGAGSTFTVILPRDS